MRSSRAVNPIEVHLRLSSFALGGLKQQQGEEAGHLFSCTSTESVCSMSYAAASLDLPLLEHQPTEVPTTTPGIADLMPAFTAYASQGP